MAENINLKNMKWTLKSSYGRCLGFLIWLKLEMTNITSSREINVCIFNGKQPEVRVSIAKEDDHKGLLNNFFATRGISKVHCHHKDQEKIWPT